MRNPTGLSASLVTLLILSSCGPGDAPYRFFVRTLDLQLHDPHEALPDSSMNLLGTCGSSPAQIKADIGLMKTDLPGMQSIPRHLKIDPNQEGWLTEITPPVQSPGSYSIRIRGTRPQELQFQPGSYLIAVTGYANCSGAAGDSKLPFVYYSPPQSFGPGNELNFVAAAKFGDQALECSYSPYPGPSPPPGFASLNAGSVSGTNATVLGVDLVSPTAPSLTGPLRVEYCSSASIIVGPVPARGRYLVRVKVSSGSTGTYSKCYQFEGTGSSIDLSGQEFTPCPATGTFNPP